MRTRRNLLDSHSCDDDWYTPLLKSLSAAEEGTASSALLEAIRHMKALLAETDEFIHTVTVSRPLPAGLDEAFVIACVKDTPSGEEVAVKTGMVRCITLTFTARGSLECVEKHAEMLLSRGIGMAEFVLHSLHR